MPKTLQYKSGSLIYAKSDDADRIFILQSGKISLVYEHIENGEDIKDQVQPGDFFGVKSTLGHYPREENAIALSDSTVVSFTIPEFEAMAESNTDIIMKMLKVLSSQMRQIHVKVSKLLEEGEIKPDEGLFAIGEKYMKLKRFAHAKYIFERYLEYYPNSKKAAIASKNRQLAEISLEFANAENNGGPRPERTGHRRSPEELHSADRSREGKSGTNKKGSKAKRKNNE